MARRRSGERVVGRLGRLPGDRRGAGVRGDVRRRVGDDGESLKRVPPGFPPDHPAADLLRLKNVTFGRRLSDEEALSPDLPDGDRRHVRGRDAADALPRRRSGRTPSGLRPGSGLAERLAPSWPDVRRASRRRPRPIRLKTTPTANARWSASMNGPRSIPAEPVWVPGEDREQHLGIDDARHQPEGEGDADHEADLGRASSAHLPPSPAWRAGRRPSPRSCSARRRAPSPRRRSAATARAARRRVDRDRDEPARPTAVTSIPSRGEHPRAGSVGERAADRREDEQPDRERAEQEAGRRPGRSRGRPGDRTRAGTARRSGRCR